MFDTALEQLSEYWKNSSFDGHEILVKPIHCLEDQLLWDDYEKVKEFINSSLNQFHKFSELNKEFQAMLLHLDNHLNKIVFVKCENTSYCSNWKSQNLKDFLAKFDMKLFASSFDTYRDGHYDTFLQSCIRQEHTFGDSGQPTAEQKNLGKCKFCPSYYFKSQK